MRKTIIICLLLLVLLTACALTNSKNSTGDQQDQVIPVDQSPKYIPEYKSAPCPFSLPEGIEENKDVDCGVLTVPEDRSNPSTGDVDIAVAIFHSPNQQELESEPIVFVEGGPGAEVLSKLSLVFPMFEPLLKNRDLIFFDPRGVGFSSPSLDCPEYSQVMGVVLEKDLKTAEAEQLGLDALYDCGQRLTDSGINLSAFNVQESAADLIDLRSVLAFDQWNLFSVSYGTRVVQEMLRTSPEGIRSIVLDSAVLLEANMLEEAPQNISRSLDLLFTSCSEDPACQAAYPDLKTQLNELVESLNTEPIETPLVNLINGERYDSVKAAGSSLLNVVITGLYSNQVIPYLPKLISDTAVGDYALLTSLRSNQFTGQMFSSEGAYYAGVCFDEVPVNSLEKIIINSSEFYLLDDFFTQSYGGEKIYHLCNQWGIGEADNLVNQGVISDLPALVLAGQLDPASPPNWGMEVSGNLTHSTYIEFPNLAHSVTLSHPCPMEITLAFFNDPSAAPNTSCIDDIELSFVTPTGLAENNLIPITIQETGIQAVVPENWIAAKSDYYVSPDQKYELVFTREQDSPLDDFLKAWGVVDPGTEFSNGPMTWEVYIVQRDEVGKIVFLAVSPAEEGFFLTLIVGPIDEEEQIRDYLFLPVLQAFRVGE